jgi:hypothetical protein
MTSEKQVRANRRNGLQARGAITTAGKEHSAKNSRVHGFYACKSHVSETEKPEFNALRQRLLCQLAPQTPMQRFVFERVVFSCWRWGLAERLEAHALKAYLGDLGGEAKKEATPVERPLTREPYLSSSQALRDGIKFLTFLEQDVPSFGSVREELKDDVTRVFGVDSFEEFARWTPMPRDVILAAFHMVGMDQTYHLKPCVDIEEVSKHVIIDPQQGVEMVLKLIGQKKRHLEDLLSLQRSGVLANVQNAEFAPRFFTTAMRDMQRTVQWFQELKEKGL